MTAKIFFKSRTLGEKERKKILQFYSLLCSQLSDTAGAIVLFYFLKVLKLNLNNTESDQVLR